MSRGRAAGRTPEELKKHRAARDALAELALCELDPLSSVLPELPRLGRRGGTNAARVAELADAPDLGSGSGNGVKVQVLSRAPLRSLRKSKKSRKQRQRRPPKRRSTTWATRGRMAFVVIYDACVLYPAPLRDLLVRVGLTPLVRVRWTDTILDECFRNIFEQRPELKPEALDRTRELMTQAIPDCMVTGYEPLIDGLLLPDPDDRYVLAAAIRAGAQSIVTFNLKDFPAPALQTLGVEAVHPDDFVLDLIDFDGAGVAQKAMAIAIDTVEESISIVHGEGYGLQRCKTEGWIFSCPVGSSWLQMKEDRFFANFKEHPAAKQRVCGERRHDCRCVGACVGVYELLRFAFRRVQLRVPTRADRIRDPDSRPFAAAVATDLAGTVLSVGLKTAESRAYLNTNLSVNFY